MAKLTYTATLDLPRVQGIALERYICKIPTYGSIVETPAGSVAINLRVTKARLSLRLTHFDGVIESGWHDQLDAAVLACRAIALKRNIAAVAWLLTEIEVQP
jgi:hypothetical protein